MCWRFDLAEANDKSSFDIKLFFLKEKWESLWPDDFVASLIYSAREGTHDKNLYFQNKVESKHFLRKLSQEFKKNSTEILRKSLSKIAERQNLEEVQAIFHGGRYAFSAIQKILRGNFTVAFLF